MKRTMKLRFLERTVVVGVAAGGPLDGTNLVRTERVLQQWWQDPTMSEDEDPRLTGGYWEDVELEIEEKP